MKRHFKIPLLSMMALAVVGVFLWMLSLSSWRLTKVGRDAYSMIIFLASDGRTVLTVYPGETRDHFYIHDIVNGKVTLWPENIPVDFLHEPTFSQSSPELTATFKTKGNQGELLILEVRSGRVKRTVHWAIKKPLFPKVILSPDGKRVAIIQNNDFLQWDIESGKSIRRLRLAPPWPPEGFFGYALSSDGTKIIGCSAGQGRIWSVVSGQSLSSWKAIAHQYQISFSPDARRCLCVACHNRNPDLLFCGYLDGESQVAN